MFYDYMIYKVRMRENLNIAIKGEFESTTAESRAVEHQTRSGKSTVGLSIGNFISSMTKVPYTDFHICANESEYYSKVRNAKFNELYHSLALQESWNADGNRRAERVQRLVTVGQIRRRVVQKLKAEQRRDGDYGQNYWAARIPRNSEHYCKSLLVDAISVQNSALYKALKYMFWTNLHPASSRSPCQNLLA
jgi:hypothetical protein